jgi:capsular exopolysaccharide synthesis family protein
MSRKNTTLMSSGSSTELVPHATATAVSPAVLAPAPAARKTQTAPSALALLKALRRRWLLATICALLGSALTAAGVWFGMPMKYTTSAMLHIASQEPRVLGIETGGYGEFAAYQKSQAAMITNRIVLMAALKDAEVARLSILPRDPDRQIDWLQQEIKVDFKAGPELMRVSMAGYQPEEMKKLVNAVTSIYLQDVVNKERSRKNHRLKQLEEIQDKRDKRMKQQRDLVNKMVVGLGSGDPQVLAVKQRYANEALGEARRELRQIQAELRRLGIELKAREGREESAAPEVPKEVVEQALNKEPAIVQLTTQRDLHKKKLDRAAELAVRGREEPALRHMVEHLETLEAEIETMRNRLRSDIKERLQAKTGSDRYASVTDLRRRYDFSRELEKSLQESVEQLQKETKTANVDQVEVESAKLDIEQMVKLSDRLATEVETLKVEVEAPHRVVLLEEASSSLGAMERQRIKATAGGAAAALFLVLGFISWREYRYRRLDSPQELSQDLGMRVVGALPGFPAPTRSLLPWRSTNVDGWQDILTECVDATRASLLHAAREKDARVVLVTSALGGEGKTSLSCHLAGSLARAGFRTLLIDGDMRRPTIHRAFNVAAREGLSELLRQEVELDRVVHATAIFNLWLIAGGQWDQAATSALARSRLPALLKTLREQYEYIIIDSAPLLPVVDSLLIGQHVDGVILSVLREVSQLPLVNTAAERLESVGVRILGVIVNGVAADVHNYRYGYAPEILPQDDPVENPST